MLSLTPLLLVFCSLSCFESVSTYRLGTPFYSTSSQIISNSASPYSSTWRFNRQSSSSQSDQNTRYTRSSSSFPGSRKRETTYWTHGGGYSHATECKFACDDGACLPSSDYRCDGFAQCWDGSDEKGCTCAEIIEKNKLCDGVQDCPDGKDEQNCVYGCQPNEFACDSHNTGSKVKCVSLTKRCDGYADCPYQTDEQDCYRLVDLKEETRGVRSKGILQKRVANLWYTVCKTTSASHYVQQYATKVCSQVVGYHNEGSILITTPTLSSLRQQMSKQQTQDLRYLRVAETETKFLGLSQCASDRIYHVECPTPQCGGIGNSDNARRRRRRDTNGDDDDDDLLLGIDDEEDSDGMEMIVGGYSTQETEWPFLVGIYRDGEFYCGGSIVNEYWILTAAHCCHKYDQHVYEVQAGMTRRYSWSPYEQTRAVKEIHVHEQYDPKVFANDIALYKLDKPLHLSKYVTPACFPSGYDDDPGSGHYCTVAGWGDLEENGSGPDHMQQVELPVLDKCTETFTRDTYQICAGYAEGQRDACQGDSGGPLLCTTSSGKRVVSGVVSFGRGCARANEAGAYTRISAYLDWMNGVVNNEHAYTYNHLLPKQCLETCYKPGGECLYPEEKCSGTVECLGAQDETDCYHLVTRNGGGRDYMYSYSSAYSPFMGNYRDQSPGAVLSRSGGGGGARQPYRMRSNVTYPLRERFPMPIMRALGARSSSDVVSNEVECKPEDFRCSADASKNCIADTKVCDRVTDCSTRNDEISCFALTENYKNPLDTFKMTSQGILKGFVMARMNGASWHPVSMEWSQSTGQAICEGLLDGGVLLSMETIRLADLAPRLRSDALVEPVVIVSQTDALFEKASSRGASTQSQLANTATKVTMSAESSGAISILAESMDMGYVQCSTKERLLSQ